MKKFNLGILFFFSFFIFCLTPKADTQLIIDNYQNNYSKGQMHGFDLYKRGYGSPFVYGYLNAYRDYYLYTHQDLIPSKDPFLMYKDSFDLMYSFGNNLYLYLTGLLPTSAIVKDYYTISYSAFTDNWSSVDSGIYLYLIYYDEPIVYGDLNELKQFKFANSFSNIDDNTFVYRFKVTNTSITFIGQNTLTYSNILSNFNFGLGTIYKKNDFYYIRSSFYNYFYMSNFSLFPDTENVSFVPAYQVVLLDDDVKKFSYLLKNDTKNYYGLQFFNKYAFSGGTLGVQPFYKVLNYETSMKAPFNGQYSQYIFNDRHRVVYLKNIYDNTRLYFNGDVIVTYTENNEPTLKKDTTMYHCSRDKLDDFCTIDLDFKDLENSGVMLIFDEETIVEQYKFNLPVLPIIWYKMSDLDLYSTSVTDLNDYTCFNCEPDENGVLPNLKIDRENIFNFLDTIDIKTIETVNDVSNINSIFKIAYSGAKSILNCGIEILSLVTSFFSSLGSVVQAVLILIFIASVIGIFVKSIM